MANPRVLLTGRVPYIKNLPAKVFREIRRTPSSFSPGHGACPGCGGMLALQTVSRVINYVAEQVGAGGVAQSQQTGCLEVITSTGDMSAILDRSGKGSVRSYLHSTFSGGPSQLQGMYAAYSSLRAQGKITSPRLFWGFAGDGGVLDIGMADLSSFLVSQTVALLVNYDNRGFMNTGEQASSTTMLGEHRTTAPKGTFIVGQTIFPKDVLKIVADHKPVYAASASMVNVRDLMRKTMIAILTNGPTFLHIDAPCPREWRHPADQTIKIAELAIDTGVFRLAEVVEGKWILNAERKRDEEGNILPFSEYAKSMGHLRHLADEKNVSILNLNQRYINEKWDEIKSDVEKTEQVEIQEVEVEQALKEYEARFARGGF